MAAFQETHVLQFVRLFVVLSIVRRGLAMMSKRNFSAWNPSLCTDLAGLECSLVLCALLVSQSSRTCACSPTSNPSIISRPVSTPCLTSRLYYRSQLHHPGRPRALRQPAPVHSVLVSIVLRSNSPLSNPVCLVLRLTLSPFGSCSQRPGDLQLRCECTNDARNAELVEPIHPLNSETHCFRFSRFQVLFAYLTSHNYDFAYVLAQRTLRSVTG